MNRGVFNLLLKDGKLVNKWPSSRNYFCPRLVDGLTAFGGQIYVNRGMWENLHMPAARTESKEDMLSSLERSLISARMLLGIYDSP